MNNSYYDNPHHLIPGRVSGYSKGPEGIINAEYISMTQPYAAGALASSVDDLALWDSALYSDKLLSQKVLKQAFIPHLLSDGSSTSYGFGWEISDYEGHQFIEHGGGIHGFVSYAIRIPEIKAFVVVLSNNQEFIPEEVAFKIAALLIC